MRPVNECVLYQLFLRPFTPEGTLNAAQKLLPHLKDVGVDILYLCPITYADEDPRPEYWSNRQRECGFNNPQNPYRVGDFYRVDPEYGTDDDLRAFVQAAHALDMYVLLDVVYMHCGPTCGLVTERPELFEYDVLGSLVTTTYHFPKFDFNKEATRAYFRENMLYFVEKFDVDGYRCDCGDILPTDFWKESIDALRAVKPGVIMLNEGGKPENLTAGFDLDYGCCWSFSLEKLVLGEYWNERQKAILPESMTAIDVLRDLKRMSDSKPKGKLGALGLENHDVVNDAWYHRVESLIGPKAMEAALAVCFTAKGYPFLYTGEEIADTTRHGLNVNHVYAPNCRVNWSYARTDDGKRRLRFVREMSRLRHAHKALCDGEMTILSHNQEEKIMAYVRETDGERVLVMASFSSIPLTVKLEMNIKPTEVLYARDADGTTLGAFGLLIARV